MKHSKRRIVSLLSALFLSLCAYQLTNDSTPSTQRLLAANYTTSSTRTNSVSLFCDGLTRTTLIDSTLSAQYSLFSAQISKMLTLDGNSMIANILASNYREVQSQANKNWSQLLLFIGPFVVGLVLLVVLSPFILCCCACPASCPLKCCRKSQDEQYSKCELFWPVVILLLALLLAIGACIAGFSQSQMITSAFNSVSCASSIILDDILNGNVTTDGSSFFVGLNQLYTQLGYLSTNLSSINTTMSNLQPNSSNITAVNSAATNALTDIAKIPNNANAGGNMAAILYGTPLNSAATNSSINSAFPAALGSSTTGGYVGSLYTAVSAAMNTIANISTSADNFISQTNTLQSSLASLQSTVKNFTNFILSTDSSFFTSLSTASSDSNYLLTGAKVLYTATIAMASLMLLGALLVSFCDKTNCRYLIYVTCFFLFLLGLLGFTLSIVLSVLTPAVYFGCQYMNFSLNSPANFNSNFGNLITDSTIRGYISTCLPTSSGDLVTALGGNAVSAIQNLSASLTAIGSYNTTAQANTLLSAMNQVSSLISNYQSGVIADINDTPSYAVLSQLSKSSSYSSCTSASFASDSWVPSVSQSPSYVACNIASGNNATTSNCGGADFASAGGTCNGCMDTTSVLNTATYSTKTAVLNALNSRYTAAGCSTFNNDLANVWNNYYYVKSSAFSPVASRANTANTKVNTFVTNITQTLNATFTNAVSSLNSISQSVTDSKYGLVAGLNCKLIGQDFATFATTFCQSMFTVLYFSRLVAGCGSFGILFAICCGACTGVRFYKQSIRKLNSIDNTGLSDNQQQDITNTNFVKPKILQ